LGADDPKRALGARVGPRKYPPRVGGVNEDLCKEWEEEPRP